MRPAWRIYYGDGTSYASLLGAPSSAPPWGVQAIVQVCSDEGKNVLVRCDYYWHDGDRWHGGDFVGLIDYLAHCPHPLCVRFGRRIRPVEFERMQRMAETDPDFIGGGVWRTEGGDTVGRGDK